MSRRRLPVLALAALLAAASAAVPVPVPLLAAETEPAARPQVGRPVEAAQLLLKQHKFKAALAKLAEADAVRARTPYETYLVAATRAAVLQASGDDAGAVKALEAALATGVLPPGEVVRRLALLAALSYAAKDYAGAVAYAERYYAAGGDAAEPRLLMAQALYVRGDFAGAAAACRALRAAADRTGKPVPEAALQMLADSEYRQQHEAAYRAALMALVARYPTKPSWRQLIAAVRREPGFADRLDLDLDRVRAATGTLETPERTMAAAERALAAGLAGEAKALLDQGFAAGVLGQGADAARQRRLLALATRQAEDELKDLPRRAKAADEARDGAPAAALGEAYAGFGKWPEAITALQAALRKGGLGHPEDAKLHLGIAYLCAGQTEAGEATLRGLVGADGTGALAQLWLLVAKARPPARP